MSLLALFRFPLLTNNRSPHIANTDTTNAASLANY